ncbi:TPA: alpha/beta hydrolase [Pseudomonas aeruginosa]|nr:alpha/beta hydrolase [Pseudomonas aeruginosa]
MSNHNILLIHGTWCNGGNWGNFATELKDRGFTVYTPSLRHHGAPSEDTWMNAQKVAKVGLLDYVEDILELVDAMDSPPIIVGHSLGGLIAQLVAERRLNKGLILLGTAPTAGMFNLYTTSILVWLRYLPQWLMRKPMYPCSWDLWKKRICNSQSEEIQKLYYGTLCAESGTAYFEMALWYLDRKRSARVNFDAITSPVLVVSGLEDKCVAPRIARVTAQRYSYLSTLEEISGSDHMMIFGGYMHETLARIDLWLKKHNLAPVTSTK